MVTLKCHICRKLFSAKPYRAAKAKYCSKICYGISCRGRVPASAFRPGQHSSPSTEFKPGSLHPYFGKSSPALHKRWGLSGAGRGIRYQLMARPEYRKWRKDVFTRDNYTCQDCGLRGVRLHADHIKPYALFPELIFVLENGRTLCAPCHYKTPTFGRRTRRPSLKTTNQ